MGKKQIVSAGTTLLLLFVFSLSHAAMEPGEGYDENTEVTIKGAVTEIIKGKRGPVRLRMIYQGKTYYVVTAPIWYLRREGITFQQGSGLEVTGSKYFGKDGNIYVIARKIREEKTGKEVFFRDAMCIPMWHGMRNR